MLLIGLQWPSDLVVHWLYQAQFCQSFRQSLSLGQVHWSTADRVDVAKSNVDIIIIFGQKK